MSSKQIQNSSNTERRVDKLVLLLIIMLTFAFSLVLFIIPLPYLFPFCSMLDVGSGGASLGMLAKRRYDVQVVSTVFADWPYCEYITERGQVCMYVDAMEAMPFAKFSYDVVHSSWVFHALFSHQLRAAYLEQNRILRPGGYMSFFYLDWWDIFSALRNKSKREV